MLAAGEFREESRSENDLMKRIGVNAKQMPFRQDHFRLVTVSLGEGARRFHRPQYS